MISVVFGPSQYQVISYPPFPLHDNVVNHRFDLLYRREQRCRHHGGPHLLHMRLLHLREESLAKHQEELEMHGSVLPAEERQRDVLGEHLIGLCETPEVLQILIDGSDQLPLLPFIQIFIGRVVKSLPGGREAGRETDALVGGVLN